MAELTLIWFDGCPNVGRAREALRRAGQTWREVRQDDLPPDHPLRRYSSPSILNRDRVVFGSASGAAGCSIGPLDTNQILSALDRSDVQ